MQATNLLGVCSVLGSGKTTQTVSVVSIPCSCKIKECAAWNDRSRLTNTSWVDSDSFGFRDENSALFKYSMLPWTADLAAILAFGPA